MATIETNHISKTFGSVRAVDDVSFDVEPGEIFGLLGPNGAGKTTIIRLILDIFKPDIGEISILGGAMSEEKKNLIGYLPEERGLYQDITLERCLVYLATLKGLTPADAKSRIDEYLNRFDLSNYGNKKIKELSKGMQQKAQLIVTLVHRPKIIIVDEPFSSLDPINTQMVKDLLLEEKKQGVTIVMSTHQMHQVEELCDRILLIDKGKVMLYGNLLDIQKQYAGSDVLLRTKEKLPDKINGVKEILLKNGSVVLKLEQGITPQQLLENLVAENLQIEKFEVALPSLDDIFIKVVTDKGSWNE
jgi:ABC-2 type transport system ATP-binding protein